MLAVLCTQAPMVSQSHLRSDLKDKVQRLPRRDPEAHNLYSTGDHLSRSGLSCLLPQRMSTHLTYCILELQLEENASHNMITRDLSTSEIDAVSLLKCESLCAREENWENAQSDIKRKPAKQQQSLVCGAIQFCTPKPIPQDSLATPPLHLPGNCTGLESRGESCKFSATEVSTTVLGIWPWLADMFWLYQTIYSQCRQITRSTFIGTFSYRRSCKVLTSRLRKNLSVDALVSLYLDPHAQPFAFQWGSHPSLCVIWHCSSCTPSHKQEGGHSWRWFSYAGQLKSPDCSSLQRRRASRQAKWCLLPGAPLSTACLHFPRNPARRWKPLACLQHSRSPEYHWDGW